MTTDTDPRVQHAIELAGESRRDELAALKAYLAAEFDKVPSAPVEAVPDSRQNCQNLTVGKDGECVHCYAKAGQECQYEPTSDDALSDRYVEQRNEIDRLETEVARLTAERDVLLKCIEAANQNLAGHSRQIDVLTAELQEVQKDASPAMCQAALDASRQYNESEAPLPRGRELWAAAIVWRAMLSAAPEAPKP